MPMYVVQRSFNVGPDRMPEIGRRSRELIEDQFPVITWHHSHVTVDDVGYVHTFCIYESPDPESIREHSRVLGYHIIDEIFEIAGDVTPADFPPLKAG
jgi:Nickel responsive protein SCO4226-like